MHIIAFKGQEFIIPFRHIQHSQKIKNVWEKICKLQHKKNFFRDHLELKLASSVINTRSRWRN